MDWSAQNPPHMYIFQRFPQSEYAEYKALLPYFLSGISPLYFLDFYCPIELFVVVKMFHSGSHLSHEAVEDLKCGAPENGIFNFN